MTDETIIIINEDAWKDVFDITASVILSMSKWGIKHNMPATIPVAMILGMADAMSTLADLCDCDGCTDVVETVADELSRRVLSAVYEAGGVEALRRTMH